MLTATKQAEPQDRPIVSKIDHKRTPERPQSADIPAYIRRSSFGTLRPRLPHDVQPSRLLQVLQYAWF